MDEQSPGHSALRKGRFSQPHTTYLVTTTTYDRTPIFRCFPAACAAARCFGDPRLLDDGHMLAWVLMPDHAHWLLQIGSGASLNSLVNRLKSCSARHVNQCLGRSGTLWARAYHDRALRRDEDLRAAARYVVANPLRAGLVAKVGDYPFWNAVWL
ncbi:transposase [Pseudomonas sp. R3.Fl]|uniref:REP-associated tyrosine transposase n=1 Tax=Pseudomonas TaxID=286 RepID=UPI00072A50FA|nr:MULTISPECIES: transposase [Pseudomonas]AMO77890.1 Transposase IS200 like protein [Pseudomonas citronellolis]KRV77267.1 transposase [Pseudomonas citronellolis]MCL6688394.1 transposase [Pseudomonas sp. R3.Fl]MCP1604251.1 REP element-mobilizing transposase RayT [Pseudomonas citronellolis]MCP1655074.1 REP element-mobilizing transposase RayT [Pseudomonas citronellolis]